MIILLGFLDWIISCCERGIASVSPRKDGWGGSRVRQEVVISLIVWITEPRQNTSKLDESSFERGIASVSPRKDGWGGSRVRQKVEISLIVWITEPRQNTSKLDESSFERGIASVSPRKDGLGGVASSSGGGGPLLQI